MSREDGLSACLDANVFISALAFGGKPLRILERLLRREFQHVTSVVILEEVRRNLVGKLGVSAYQIDPLLQDVLDVSSAYAPTGKERYIDHVADGLVLETAILGNVDVLVTGDKRHLLPLNPFRGITIEPPGKFLLRLDAQG